MMMIILLSSYYVPGPMLEVHTLPLLSKGFSSRRTRGQRACNLRQPVEMLEQRRANQGKSRHSQGTDSVRVIREGLWRRNDLNDVWRELLVHSQVRMGEKTIPHRGNTIHSLIYLTNIYSTPSKISIFTELTVFWSKKKKKKALVGECKVF